MEAVEQVRELIGTLRLIEVQRQQQDITQCCRASFTLTIQVVSKGAISRCYLELIDLFRAEFLIASLLVGDIFAGGDGGFKRLFSNWINVAHLFLRHVDVFTNRGITEAMTSAILTFFKQTQ